MIAAATQSSRRAFCCVGVFVRLKHWKILENSDSCTVLINFLNLGAARAVSPMAANLGEAEGFFRRHERELDIAVPAAATPPSRSPEIASLLFFIDGGVGANKKPVGVG
ncbi:hypothetical protein MLD38_029172 [Melastoma candidum]|uniref:Uncharacterized protein n=1 Tax=Melastoma candidum TaxID=119954 RepID=A0ACB9N3T0_9MYRT|nr:hypothetical protein MLD38_029172 [Melastoma candidum]